MQASDLFASPRRSGGTFLERFLENTSILTGSLCRFKRFLEGVAAEVSSVSRLK